MNVCGAEHITVLEGLEAVRRRPGMYVGDPRERRSLHQLVWELVSNAIDEHLAGHARQIAVTIVDDVVTVEDDGRGIAWGRDPLSGRPGLEAVFGRLHHGGTLDGHRPHVHVSLHGLGAAVVTALSAWLEVEVRLDGRRFRQRFERGRAVSEVMDDGLADGTGTRVRFEPDRAIITAAWDEAAVHARLQTLACLNPRATFFFQDEAFWAPAGLCELARLAASDDVLVAAPLHIVVDGDVPTEIVLAWVRERRSSTLRAFVSQFETPDGSHVRGLRRGLTSALRASDPRLADLSPRVAYELLSPGMIAIVNVSLDHPRFDDPCRERLDAPEADRVVHECVAAAFTSALRNNMRLREHLMPRWSHVLE